MHGLTIGVVATSFHVHIKNEVLTVFYCVRILVLQINCAWDLEHPVYRIKIKHFESFWEDSLNILNPLERIHWTSWILLRGFAEHLESSREDSPKLLNPPMRIHIEALFPVVYIKKIKIKLFCHIIYFSRASNVSIKQRRSDYGTCTLIDPPTPSLSMVHAWLEFELESVETSCGLFSHGWSSCTTCTRKESCLDCSFSGCGCRIRNIIANPLFWIKNPTLMLCLLQEVPRHRLL